MRPSYSITVMFLPISPRPPRGSTRSLLGTSCCSLSLSVVLTGYRDTGGVETGLDGGPLLGVGGYQGESKSVRAEAEHLQCGLERNRVGGDGEALVERRQLGVELARPIEVTGPCGVPHLAHSIAGNVGCHSDAPGAAELEHPQEDVVVAGQDLQALDRPKLLVVGLLDSNDVVDQRQLGEQVGLHVD